MAKFRYTISFPSKETELICFVDEKRKQKGMSAYIRDLVQKDMENQDTGYFEEIYLYIEKRLRENGFVHKEAENNVAKTIVDEGDKEVFLNLF